MFNLNDRVIVNGSFEGFSAVNEKGTIINIGGIDKEKCTVLFDKKDIGVHKGFKKDIANFIGVEANIRNCWCYPLDFIGFTKINKQLNLFEE